MASIRTFRTSGTATDLAGGTRSAPRRARIFLLSNVRLYREGLLWSLARRGAFEIVGTGGFSGATLTTAVELMPDAVILHVGVAEGFAAAKSLSSRLPNTKVVAFAVSEVDHLVVACAEAGISGYVAPDGSEEDLVRAVEFALRGELYCSPRIAGLLFRRISALSSQLAGPSEPDALSRRERQILDLVGEGMSNKEIGRALRISDATVKNHVHNILEKLRVHGRGEAEEMLRSGQQAMMRSDDRRAPPTAPR